MWLRMVSDEWHRKGPGRKVNIRTDRFKAAARSSPVGARVLRVPLPSKSLCNPFHLLMGY